MAAKKIAHQIDNPVVVVEGGITALSDEFLKQSKKAVIPLDRQVQIVVGSLVVTGVAMGALVNPMGFGLSAFVGCGLIFAGISGTCLMARLVAKMPWNQ